MSSEAESDSVLRNVKSPFTKVIATEYYDGAIEGFLQHKSDADAYVFQLLDWDRATDARLYEIARVPEVTFEAIVAQLYDEKLPTWPLWVLPPKRRSPGEDLFHTAFGGAEPVATITTSDLLGTIALWDPSESGAGFAPRGVARRVFKSSVEPR